MRRELIFVVVPAGVLIAARAAFARRAGSRGAQPSGAQAPATPAAPARGAAAPTVPAPIAPPKPFVPEGFTPLFNGESLAGWHVSKTNHHGTTPDYHVLHGSDCRDAESAWARRHPADRQEIQERRALHGSEAGLWLRQRPVLPVERSGRCVPGDDGLPAGWFDWRHLRGRARGRGRPRQRAGSCRGGARPGVRRPARRDRPSLPRQPAAEQRRRRPRWPAEFPSAARRPRATLRG